MAAFVVDVGWAMPTNSFRLGEKGKRLNGEKEKEL
jgi:hypothetical protein